MVPGPKLKPLSETLEQFNKDKNPLEQLQSGTIKNTLARKPPNLVTDPGGLAVKRTPNHGKTRGRLPFRIVDAGKLVIDAVANGCTYHLAAKYAGISPQTLFNWMARAEQILDRLDREMAANNDGTGDIEADPLVSADEVIYLDFYMRLQQAEGHAVIGWLKAINQAAQDGKWQAAAWMLERRHPSQYGKTTQVHQHHTKQTIETVDEWRNKQKKQLEAAQKTIDEFEDVEDVDYRIVGKPVPVTEQSSSQTDDSASSTSNGASSTDSDDNGDPH